MPVTLTTWSWIWLAMYIAIMIWLGTRGGGKVHGADDFATARRGYGAMFLAVAFASTTASGATFLGLPALAYTLGFASVGIAFVYPLGIYLGVLICQRAVAASGHRFGNRSIPEYLGDRYGSEAMRLISALFSLILLFYLAGQLVAGLVMFQMLLGLEQGLALTLTSAVLMVYVTIGGAHADILTDGVQGLLMLFIAVLIVGMFAIGFGVEGGFGGMVESLRAEDPKLVPLYVEGAPLAGSPWLLFSIFAAHLPLGMLPHIGNKLWALRDERSQLTFVGLAFALGMVFAAMTFGGILARAVLGDELLATPGGPNGAIPALFVEVFPVWLAALLGAGIMAAVMSTADGLVVSASQVFANDVYRRTLVPRWHADVDPAVIDRRVLVISRVGTVVIMGLATALAWATVDRNITLLVWTGIGGMTAAIAGPVVLGVLWQRLTPQGAITGFVAGASVFVIAHGGLFDPAWAGQSALRPLADWIAAQQPNPYACSVIGQAASVAACVVVSLVTRPLPQERLARVFGKRA